MILSERDADLLQALTLKVRLLELSQIAQSWWPSSAWSEKNARERLAKLAAEGFLRQRKILVRPFLRLTKPAAVWVPDEPSPNFASLSWRLQSRWTLPPIPMSVFFATNRAAKRFGGFARGQIKNLCQVTHDLHVSAIFLKWHRDSPDFVARWIGEDVFAPERQGEKLPDAVLVDEARRPIHVIEFGGAYSRERLEDFHDDCANRELSYEIW